MEWSWEGGRQRMERSCEGKREQADAWTVDSQKPLQIK